MPEQMRQAAYARRIGISRQRVTALKQQGAIVMTEDGKQVDVDATDKRLEAYLSGLPQHQARRDQFVIPAATESAETAETDASVNDTTPLLEVSSRKLKNSQSVKAEAEAEMAQMELKKLKGILAPIEEVTATVADAFNVLRISLESLPDKIGALVAGEHDEGRVHAIMAEEIESTLRHASEQLRDGL